MSSHNFISCILKARVSVRPGVLLFQTGGGQVNKKCADDHSPAHRNIVDNLNIITCYRYHHQRRPVILNRPVSSHHYQRPSSFAADC